MGLRTGDNWPEWKAEDWLIANWLGTEPFLLNRSSLVTLDVADHVVDLSL